MHQARPPCRRCLLAEVDGAQALAQSVAEYLSLLPEEQRVADTRYRARLALCRACDQLAGGTCRLCGCYVEVRAAKRAQACPACPPHWARADD